MMLLRNIIGAFLLALLAFKVNAHPIKMTTSKLLYDKKANELVLTINFFEDDFSAHLEKLYHRKNIDFAVVDDTEASMVAGYVAKKMLLKANKKLLFDVFAEQVNIMHLDLPGGTSNVLQFTPSDSYKVLKVNF